MAAPRNIPFVKPDARQLKIGPINFYPTSDGIFVDQEPRKRKETGIEALEVVLREKGLLPAAEIASAPASGDHLREIRLLRDHARLASLEVGRAAEDDTVMGTPRPPQSRPSPFVCQVRGLEAADALAGWQGEAAD